MLKIKLDFLNKKKLKNKHFNKKIFNKEMLKNKRLLALIFLLICTVFITLGYSYAYFSKVVVGSNVEIKVGSINYSLDSDALDDNYQIAVSPGGKTVVEVTINALDDVASKYQMYYITGSNVVVGYSSESIDLPSGEMSAKGTKKVTLIIQNNSSVVRNVTIGVAGGLNSHTVDDIVLKTGQSRITLEISPPKFDVQLASVTIDGQSTDSLPTNGTYELSSYTCSNGSSLEWDTYKKSITFSAGVPKKESCSLKFTTSTDYPLLIDKVKQGDYISYEGNNGCLRNGVATATVTTSGQGRTENYNSCLGYNANANSDGSKNPNNGMYGYCSDKGRRYYVSGWRIAYTKDGRVYIISAGSPECTVRRDSTYEKTDYIADSYLDAKKYCNSNFVDDCTNDADVHPINDTDYNLITAQATGTAGGYLYTSISGATMCGDEEPKEVCGYNNDLLDIGGDYFFAASYSEDGTDGVAWEAVARAVTMVPANFVTQAYGLRPVIRLSSNIYVTGGSGTMDDPYTIIKK